MEYNYLGMKDVPRNLGFMKLAIAGQPVLEDSDWGTSDSGKGGSSGVAAFNLQAVTTQRSATAEAADEDIEVPWKED